MMAPSLLSRLLLLSLLTGCASGAAAGGGGSRPLAQFPSREELAAAPERPLPASVFIEHATRVERWEVDPASLPAPGAAPEARVTALVRELFGAEATASVALTCAARELGQLQLTKGGAPAEGVRRYMAGRCGSSLPAITYSARELTVPAQVPDEQLWKEMTEGVRRLKNGTPARIHAGVALVRRGDRALLAMVGGQPAASLDPVGPIGPQAREVVLRGTVSEPSELIHGLINQGAHGFADCAPAEAVEPPRFALRCPLAPGDESAWIEVMSKPPRKLLSRAVLGVLAQRDGARAPYDATIAQIPATGNFSRDLLAHLNAARSRARLSPLAASPEQSAVNQRHAGAVLGSLHGGDQDAERLTLGLMAGWEIPGMIRRGDILALVTSSTTEPGAWLAEALAHPSSRSILLQPDRRFVAIGAASPSPQLGVGAVISTFATFEGNDHGADAGQVLARLNEARARRGLPPAALSTELPPLRAAADRIFQGKQPVGPAMHDALDEASQQLGRDLQGVYFEAIDLDSLEFPEPLLAGPLPGVSIAVTHHKPEGAAWGQYVVLLVALPAVRPLSARIASPSRG